MILDQLGRESDNAVERVVIRLGETVSVGRAADRDIRVLDISVSRLHCTISL